LTDIATRNLLGLPLIFSQNSRSVVSSGDKNGQFQTKVARIRHATASPG
ncbi:hypothetical protein BN1184_CK_00020, partial [Pantoea ananatis]